MLIGLTVDTVVKSREENGVLVKEPGESSVRIIQNTPEGIESGSVVISCEIGQRNALESAKERLQFVLSIINKELTNA
ncbi:hypothetical protein DRO66_02560 [Candidatus Bathyarchaeota archaeon]|nr:MAG: hypothetical protein DRO66_02560 [Candidatus Bathyarchaeota archaeon]